MPFFPESFLSKLGAKTFGEYAMRQIRKARGLNKKIVNPQPRQRAGVLDFCNVPYGQGSIPVLEWLLGQKVDPRQCGLTAVQHASGMFALYHDSVSRYRGLVSPNDPDALIFSSVPKEAIPIGWMHFNQNAFRALCQTSPIDVPHIPFWWRSGRFSNAAAPDSGTPFFDLRIPWVARIPCENSF